MTPGSIGAPPENRRIARRLGEVADLLEQQGADLFRVQAYRRAALTLVGLHEPGSPLFEREGLDGLRALPGIGESLARHIHEVVRMGRLATLRGLGAKRVAGIIDSLASRLAPGRFDPAGDARLPVLHTQRGTRHYTVLDSNTACAHRVGKTHDWVVPCHDGGDGERQCTVITSERGALKGTRIVRGREEEQEIPPGAPT